MEAPEPGDAVGEDVPDIERVVHEDDGERHLERAGEGSPLEEPPPLRGHEPRERADRRPLGERDGRRAERDYREVARQALPLRLDRTPERLAPLEPEEDGEGAGHHGAGEPERQRAAGHDARGEAVPRYISAMMRGSPSTTYRSRREIGKTASRTSPALRPIRA